MSLTAPEIYVSAGELGGRVVPGVPGSGSSGGPSIGVIAEATSTVERSGNTFQVGGVGGAGGVPAPGGLIP